MGIILSNKKEKIIEILKKNKDHVFKVTKETIYAIPEGAVCHYKDYNDFLKFVREYPNKAFIDYYHILTEIKDIEEI